MGFVDVFIKRPILSSVCSLVIILAGAICIPILPIAQYPELAPPQVVVSTFYTGASAQVVESSVTTVLEQAINGAEGMAYMQSSSGNDGSSQITITFDVTRNIDLAAVDVQNRISQVEGRLPNEVKQVGITVTKSSSGFVLGAGVYAEHGEYDSLYLSNYLDVFVRDAIKRVPGVADVIIFGERKYAMRLWLDPDRLAARGLTASDVTSALAEQNVQVAAGQVGAPPVRSTQMYQISVRAVGRLSEPAEFDNIIVKSGTDGSLVRLRDVGHAELGAESYSSRLRYSGYEAVGIGVTQLPTANALDVYNKVVAELDRLQASFPPGMKYQVAFETTSVVSESIREVVTTLIEAILLVVLVMFVFLQNWRSTVIPAITIPVALIGTFAFVKLFGFSINTLTLFGITLATGLVVDDAIVVIENIERHVHDYGTSPKESASAAMREVTGPVIATGLVLAAVFVPVAFFPGTTGRLYQQFALTIAVSMMLSVFNALTLTPALSALLLKPHEPGAHRGVLGGVGALFDRVFGVINRVIDSFTKGYVRVLHVLVNQKVVMTIIFLIGLALTAWVYRTVPSGFVPDEDQGYFIVLVQAPDGASIDYTQNILNTVEGMLAKVPEVRGTFAVGGFSFTGNGPNKGIIFVPLKPFEERIGEEHSAATVVQRMFGPFMGGISGALVIPFLPPPIQGLGQLGGFQFEVLDQTGGDIGTFAGAVGQLVGTANQTPGLTGVFTGFTAGDPQLVVTMNRERIKAMGLNLGAVTSTLQTFMGSSYVNDFDFNNRAYRVYVQADQQFRDTPQALRNFYVKASGANGGGAAPAGTDGGTTNGMVRMDDLIRVTETTSPQVISHYNLFRSAELNGNAAPGFSSGQAMQVMEQTARKVLPQGMVFDWAGQSREEIAAGNQAVLIFGLGLLLVYLVLAAQYESLTLPLVILLSVPLAVLGALLGQWGRGLINDVYCQIGLVMLIGLAAKNGILIVEFAEQLREKGLSVVEAAIEASRIRLRPILMTSFAFILGVLPLVTATGAGRAARHSVGTAVFAGMFVSTFLNLIFIPVLYVVMKTLTGGTSRPQTKMVDTTGGADV